MTPHTRTIRTPENWQAFVAWMLDNPNPYPFRICDGEGRSLSQNALIHLWFGEIAKQREDMTLDQVKGEMHRRFGLSIRRQDARFDWVWKQCGADDWPYEQQCRFLASGVLNVSSGMTTKELKQYLDALEHHAREQGWILTMPKEGVS